MIEDDKQNRAGVFNTSARGSVPPLVTTKFTVEDQGNASPRFLRSTMYNVPVSQDILKTAHIPFAMTYTPFARLEDGEVCTLSVGTGVIRKDEKIIYCDIKISGYILYQSHQYLLFGRVLPILMCK